jgi:restriction system protein
MTDQYEDLPRYRELLLPTLRAVEALGGSAKAREISDQIIDDLGFDDEMLGFTYENKPEKAVLIDRMDWARSYSKLGGALESPRRGLFLLSPLGREILALPDDEAVRRCAEMDKELRRARGAKKKPITADPAGDDENDVDLDDEDDDAWKEPVLRRLHALSPTGFEEFVIYVLRAYGLELRRVGGSGDEGIDGIGLAPITPVLSVRVAVQAKRYEPGRTVSRDAVALFQRDASAAGAERAVFVTLARFTEPARKAATLATPNVDLIDGGRLCDLMRDEEVGVKIRPEVDESFFERFDI